MSTNDLISRSKLLAEYDRQHEGPAGKARKLIEDAPGEMSAMEFAKQYRRMCEEYPDCDGCPFADNTPCEGWISIYMIDMVAIVEEWAKEHNNE